MSDAVDTVAAVTDESPSSDPTMTVELVRSAARDADVLFAARVSTLGEQTLESTASTADLEKRDRGLINYLMRDRHGSPFEHNSMTFYVQAPIFVFREFMRHRIASYNEESGRYRELQPVFYVPDATATWCRSASPAPTTSCPAPPSSTRRQDAASASSRSPRTPRTSGCSSRASPGRSRASCCR